MLRKRSRGVAQTGRGENDALARRGSPEALYTQNCGLSPRRFGTPQTAASTAAPSHAQCVGSPICHVYSLPYYESLVPLASSQRFHASVSCSLLRTTRLAPVRACFPVVTGDVFAIRSLPSRRPLPHAHNTACLRRVKASSPNVVRLVQKELIPPTNRLEACLARARSR